MAPAKKQKGVSAQPAKGGPMSEFEVRKELGRMMARDARSPLHGAIVPKERKKKEAKPPSSRKAKRSVARAETRVSIRAPEDLVARRKTDDELLAEQRVSYRDVEYTPDLDAHFFRLISTGHSLEEMSKLAGMPPLHVILRWRVIKGHPFVVTYLEAKECLKALFEERAVTVAVNPLVGRKVTKRQALDKEGKVVDLVDVQEYDNVDRSRLASDAYRWNLAILDPKRYGRQPDDGGNGNDALKELLGEFRERNRALSTGEAEP